LASATAPAFRSPAEIAKAAIESFLAASRQPELIEYGEPAIPVDRTRLQLSVSGRWLILEAWDQDTFLSRRITEVRGESSGRLELGIERFGGKRGVLLLVDSARPNSLGARRKADRQVFGSVFRRMLSREFSGWRIAELSTEPNLEESLSPSFPRAMLRRSATAWAAIAAPPGARADQALTFGLIWLDYLRQRERKLLVEGLALFVPYGEHSTLWMRLPYLDHQTARYQAFAYEDGHVFRLDPADTGNIDTRTLAPQPETLCAFEPESLIEMQLRTEIQQLDARLCTSPVYGQVSAVSGAERGILDLLAVDHSGRLHVIEIKASESLHLPLQALDYWIQAKDQASRGDFARHGYFPGIPLSERAPRLLLVAPALEFHPSNERLLRYLDPAIEVETIGIAHGWGAGVRVMFRRPR
jgi:hypothetical protein